MLKRALHAYSISCSPTTPALRATPPVSGWENGGRQGFPLLEQERWREAPGWSISKTPTLCRAVYERSPGRILKLDKFRNPLADAAIILLLLITYLPAI